MLIGLQILRNQNQLADTYLLLKAQRYLENLPNKLAIAHSTMESEFITLDKAGEEAQWFRQILKDIPL